MNEQDEKARTDQDAGPASDHPGSHFGPSYREATEIEGWALQWDTTALRKMTLAKRMRSLRQASGDR